MKRRTLLKGLAATAASGFARPACRADTVLKIGISMPITGAGFNAVGRQLAGGAEALHGSSTATRSPAARSSSSFATTAASPIPRIG